MPLNHFYSLVICGKCPNYKEGTATEIVTVQCSYTQILIMIIIIAVPSYVKAIIEF